MYQDAILYEPRKSPNPLVEKAKPPRESQGF
jgi:hypothetical protein